MDRDRQTHRKRDKQTAIESDTETQRQTNTDTATDKQIVIIFYNPRLKPKFRQKWLRHPNCPSFLPSATHPHPSSTRTAYIRSTDRQTDRQTSKLTKDKTQTEIHLFTSVLKSDRRSANCYN